MLQMIDPREKFLVRGTIDRTAIISHVRSVLVNFAAKGKHSRFYVGITGSLDTRLRQHRIEKPDFRLMVPVFEEPAHYHADAFDHVEPDTIAALRRHCSPGHQSYCADLCQRSRRIRGQALPLSAAWLTSGP